VRTKSHSFTYHPLAILVGTRFFFLRFRSNNVAPAIKGRVIQAWSSGIEGDGVGDGVGGGVGVNVGVSVGVAVPNEVVGVGVGVGVGEIGFAVNEGICVGVGVGVDVGVAVEVGVGVEIGVVDKEGSPTAIIGEGE
jgi:hypothetical protein